MGFVADRRSFNLTAGLMAIALGVGALAGVDPRLGLAAALGLAFTTIVMADLSVGLCLYAFVAFLNVIPDTGGFLSFEKVAGGLLAISWLATVANRKEARRAFVTAHPFMAGVLVFFLAWMLLGLTWAPSHSAALQSVMRYVLSAFLFLIVFTAVRTRKHVMWLVAAFVLAALGSAAYGFVTPPPPALGESDRLAGTIGDSNALAAVLVAGMALSVALAFAVDRRRSLLRLGLLVVAAACLMSVFLTLSRGGLIALGVALVAAVFIAGRWRPVAVVMAVVAGASVFVFFAVIASPSQRDRVTSFGGGGSGRTDLWKVGWRMVQAHPITGVGPGNFEPESIHYLIAPGAIHRSDLILTTQHVAHNTYLQVLSEMGIVALVPFLVILGFSLLCALQAAHIFERKRDTGMELISRAVFVGLVGILAADFFVSGQFSKQLWLLLGLAPALLAIAQRQSAGAEGLPPEAELVAPPLAPARLEPAPALPRGAVPGT